MNQIADVKDNSIVKLEDGRVGAISKNTARRRKPIFSEGPSYSEGEYLDSMKVKVECLLSPANTAFFYLECQKALMSAYDVLRCVASHPLQQDARPEDLFQWLEDERKWMQAMAAIESLCPEARAISLQVPTP